MITLFNPALVATGKLTSVDVDNPNTFKASNERIQTSTMNTQLTIDTNGNWTMLVDNTTFGCKA